MYQLFFLISISLICLLVSIKLAEHGKKTLAAMHAVVIYQFNTCN